jgi:hypothetical protein
MKLQINKLAYKFQDILESCLYIPLHTDAKINSASLLINLHQFKGFTNEQLFLENMSVDL